MKVSKLLSLTLTVIVLAVSADLTLYLPPTAETVDTWSIKYCGACRMWIKCMSKQSLYVILCSARRVANAAPSAMVWHGHVSTDSWWRVFVTIG